jgi:GTP-binding protein LepA
MVFSGIYPVDNAEFPELKDAMEKINLSDSSLSYEFENSGALGNGIRCGFLGLLHMEIIKERIEREYNIPIILTSPCVKYEVVMTNGEVKIIENPALLPDRTFIKEIQEP